jgi:hypothetical protein
MDHLSQAIAGSQRSNGKCGGRGQGKNGELQKTQKQWKRS